VKLMELTRTEFFLQNKKLIDLYDNFVKISQKFLNPLLFAQFVIETAKQHTDTAVTFITSMLKVVEKDAQATLVLRIELARRKLAAKVEEKEELKTDPVKEMLEDIKKAMDEYSGILDPIVHSRYYYAQLEYHKARGTAADYFKHALLYLTYTPLTFPKQEQIALASDLGLAALVGDTIYNFGELLQHPILKVLEGTEYTWLVELLFAFNSGDISSFKSIYDRKHKSEEVLSANVELLSQKIRILALMDLVFKRGPTNRKFSFEEIAKTCELKIDMVELLLMKAFSLRVVKGVIDQVDQSVRIKWVQARVLDLKAISSLRDRLKDWSANVQTTTAYVQENAPNLLTQ